MNKIVLDWFSYLMYQDIYFILKNIQSVQTSSLRKIQWSERNTPVKRNNSFKWIKVIIINFLIPRHSDPLWIGNFQLTNYENSIMISEVIF